MSVLAWLAALPFLIRVDLWLYERGMIQVKPWVVLTAVFTPFLAVGAFKALARRNITFGHDATILLLIALLVGAVEVTGMAKWVAPPSDAHIMFFFWLDLFTVCGAFCAGRVLGSWDRAKSLFAIALAVHAVIIAVDWSIPGLISLSSLDGRSSGFPGNPNGAAFAAAALLIGALDWERPAWSGRQVVLIALALVIVVLSGSRGGLGAVFMVLGLLLLRHLTAGSNRMEFVNRMIVGFIVGGSIVIVTWGLVGMSGSRFAKLALQGVAGDDALQERLAALDAAWHLIDAAPWTGHGTGYVYAMDVGPHNMLLRAWIENGIPGVVAHILLYCAIVLVAVTRRDWRIGAVAAAAFVMAMVSHNVTEDRTLLISFGVFLALTAAPPGLRRYAGRAISALTR